MPMRYYTFSILILTLSVLLVGCPPPPLTPRRASVASGG